MATKRADQIQQGDVVVLPSGAHRTVVSVYPAGWICANNEPGLIVTYGEPPDDDYGLGKWLGTASSTSPSARWEIAT